MNRIICIVATLLVAGPVIALAQVGSIGHVLVTASGEDYARARSDALQLSDANFKALIDQLVEADPVSRDHIVARALLLRRSNPDLAREFDQKLQNAIDNPALGARSGKPKYTAWWPRNRVELDPLAFETIVSLDGPVELLQSYTERIGRPNPENIDAVLYICRQSGIGRAAALLGPLRQAPQEVPRVTEHLVDLHMQWRREQVADGVIRVLQQLGGPDQLAALERIKEFELELMEAQGTTPWIDDAVDADIEEAIRRSAEANVALARSRPESDERERLRLERDRAMKHLKACMQRRTLHNLRRTLDEAIAQLSTASDGQKEGGDRIADRDRPGT